jgi:hypothetical protein
MPLSLETPNAPKPRILWGCARIQGERAGDEAGLPAATSLSPAGEDSPKSQGFALAIDFAPLGRWGWVASTTQSVALGSDISPLRGLGLG